MYNGILPPLPTPFKADGALDLDALRSKTHLDLAGTEVSDANVCTLAKVKGLALESVDLRNSTVSKETVATLQAALPTCRILSGKDSD